MTALLNKVTEINNKFSPFPTGTLMVSWDVISMYPSTDNEVDLAACKEALDRKKHTSPSTECLLKAIKITLECNNSIFTKNSTAKIEVQQWVRTMLVAMLT